MDMNFPHDSVSHEQEIMLDLNAIRSSIIANASARQASSETAKKLQISHETKLYSNKLHSMSGLKARILFFAQSKLNTRDGLIQDIVSGPFNPIDNNKKSSSNCTNLEYEDAVNLNSSNNVKSSALNHENNDGDIVSVNNNSINNRG